MAKKYIVDPKKDEKAELIALTQKGRSGASLILDFWKYDVKLVLDKHYIIVYYVHNTLEH